MRATHQHITVIAPCYNEGVIVIRFLEQLEQVLAMLPYFFNVVIVNDGSTDNTQTQLNNFRFHAANIQLNVQHIVTNTGHQQAIYQGLVYAQTLPGNHFIVMDADGEDGPDAIPQLLLHTDADVVNVVRSKRREALPFRLLYRVYKLLFRAVTGQQMNFGNFCLISRSVLQHAVNASFVHFPAFLAKQNGCIRTISAEREERIGGHSKMSFWKLLRHAFRSFEEYRRDAHSTEGHTYSSAPTEQGTAKAYSTT